MEKRIASETDRLINLPDNILDRVLFYLPIKDAVKTSLLSNKWRHRWAYMSYIHLNEINIKSSSLNEEHKFVKFIDRFLLHHRGPIQRFKLVTQNGLQNSCDVDSWMLFLSTRNINELSLFFLDSKKEHYKVPFSVFSTQTLSHLHLQHCLIWPPPPFKGFKNLKKLYLRDIILHCEEILENMISQSPHLEDLRLTDVSFCGHFKINAPNLFFFDIDNCFEDISFINVPKLTQALINLSLIPASDKQISNLETSRIINVLGCLTNVEKLSLDGYYLQFLAMVHLPSGFQLPFTFHNLKSLLLEVNFANLNEVVLSICLLRRTLIVERLTIEAEYAGVVGMVLDEEFWEEQHKRGISMNHLNVVKVTGVSGSQAELDFIKFVLAISPELKILRVTSKSGTDIKDSMVLLKQLTRFCRASASAKIEYNDGH